MIDRCNHTWTKEFLQYLLDVKGLKPLSVKRYRHHLDHLLNWADSSQLCSVQAKRPTLLSYVSQLSKQDQPLSLETQSRIIETAKRFFNWAILHHPAEFRKVSPAWIDTIQMRKVESQPAENVYVSLDEILQIARMPVGQQDLVMQRDQAAAVMLYLSGMRAGAFASAPIQAFDLNKHLVYQWPKEYGVKTKNGKKATTHLLPISELLEVVMRWHEVASSNLPLTAPWYAPIKNEWGAQEFSHELVGQHRSTALNKRLKIVFKAAKLPYKSAHKFRHGHAVYGRENANDMSAYKAVSMNLMHNDIRTTDSIYASMKNDDVGKEIARMTSAALPQNIDRSKGTERSSKQEKDLSNLLKAVMELIDG